MTNDTISIGPLVNPRGVFGHTSLGRVPCKACGSTTDLGVFSWLGVFRCRECIDNAVTALLAQKT